MSGAVVKYAKGQTLIIVSVLIAVILGYSLIITGNALTNVFSGRRINNQLVAKNLAEAGVAQAIWCLNQTEDLGCGGSFGPNYSGQSGVSLDTGTFSTTVSGSGNERTVTSTGTANQVQVTIKVTVFAEPDTTEVNLTFASQIGEDGLQMDNNASIIGSVVSNGPIACRQGAFIALNASSACQDTDDDNTCDSTGTSLIDRCAIGQDAQSYTISNSTVTRDAYYQVLTNSTVLGNQFPNSDPPLPVPFPISDQQIQQMKNDAAAGGTINGDFNPDSAGPVTLGPVRITGNLILDNNEQLIVTGTIWVGGNVRMSTNVSVSLDPGYGVNSGVILSDGFMRFENNGIFSGSGDPTSFIMLLSLATGGGSNNSAIELRNNATGAIFYAPNGLVYIRQGVQASNITGYQVHLENNSSIIYDSNLPNTLYSPNSGGTWKIRRGTWLIL